MWIGELKTRLSLLKKMDRETIKIETPVDKHNVILNSYITGGEKRQIRRVLFESAEPLKAEGVENNRMGNLLIEAAENKSVELVVVSVDDMIENVLQKVLDMKSKDYEFVLKEVDKVAKGLDFLG